MMKAGAPAPERKGDPDIYADRPAHLAARTGIHLLCPNGAYGLFAHGGGGRDPHARNAQVGRTAVFSCVFVADDTLPDGADGVLSR